MKIGDKYEVNDVVSEKNTAASLGSGALEVFGTPFLAAMMENAAFKLMQNDLPEGKSSVGIKLDISHVSPSPVGIHVRAVAEVTNISENGRIADFKVTGYDDAGLIGEGTHQRAVITVDRFMDKCRGKLTK
ncbi:MAG: thioesterase family protein [Clostridia bacterium]|nr:thioesterase family protein [Clostridia bacterium]